MATNVFGIDVSLYQGDFDFAKAKAEGVKYAIIKCGENNFADPKFERNYKAAKAAGLPIGAYYLGTFSSVSGAKSAAAYCASLLKGKQFEYPIFLDVEDGRMDVGKDQMTKNITAFCEAMENAGYWCGFYTNLDWYTHKMYGAQLANRFSFWFAYWGGSMYPLPGVQMWQQGAKPIAGVNCDYDYCFVDYPTLIKSRGKNGFAKTGQTPIATPRPAGSAINPGDKVKIDFGAPIYGTDDKFASWVYNTVYYIREVDGNRAVFAPTLTGAITGAVDTKYLKKV